MRNDDTDDFFREQLTLLARRVERLEGKVEQLRAEAIRPGLVCPTIREFQQLEDRVKKMENEV